MTLTNVFCEARVFISAASSDTCFRCLSLESNVAFDQSNPSRYLKDAVITLSLKDFKEPALLCTCRTIREEATSIYLAENTFVAENQIGIHAFLARMSAPKRKLIRTIAIQVMTSNMLFLLGEVMELESDLRALGLKVVDGTIKASRNRNCNRRNVEWMSRKEMQERLRVLAALGWDNTMDLHSHQCQPLHF